MFYEVVNSCVYSNYITGLTWYRQRAFITKMACTFKVRLNTLPQPMNIKNLDLLFKKLT